MFDFGNGKDGLYPLKGTAAVAGTALDDAIFGTLLLPGPGKPRSVDLWPAFHTGVPNVPPYQLATGKNGNPLAAGKPFVNNFLPNGGDMLRLNMAVPPTPRNSSKFSTLGLIDAAVRGLTEAPYANSTKIEFIPNMDGFPNGRRLEDDVTRIELQAVSGVVLAAIGLWYDDYMPGQSNSPVTQQLINVLTYETGVSANDVPFRPRFPYLALPHAGDGACGGTLVNDFKPDNPDASLIGLDRGSVSSTGIVQLINFPNPFTASTTIRYQLDQEAEVNLSVFDQQGKLLATLANGTQSAGIHEASFNSAQLPAGLYFARLASGKDMQVLKLFKQ
ncbi:MAG: DUF4331 family protein, partial [Lewinellaceae bacterium]|nr:DUF4331 family protein [Lewinellaceae bacterium]